jgi:hypothetical protein
MQHASHVNGLLVLFEKYWRSVYTVLLLSWREREHLWIYCPAGKTKTYDKDI